MLKKALLAVAVAAAALSSGVASASTFQAATYQLNSGTYNWSLFNVTGVTVTNWGNTTLSINSTGDATLNGSFLASNGTNYTISMALSSAYMNGTTEMWAHQTGSIVGGGTTTSLNDMMAGQNSMNAALGVNAAPYNTANNLMEFGFWSNSQPMAGVHNFDVNTTVTCISGTPTATGACPAGGTTSSSGGGSVPVPGTLALAGLGIVGMAARKFMKRKV